MEQIFDTNKFSLENLDKYFSEIEATLELNKYDASNYPQNKDSIKLEEIAKKYKINVATVPKSINSTVDKNMLH